MAPKDFPTNDPRIVIGQNRWIWVGWFEIQGIWIVLHGARCIRRWGTIGDDTGLATLANKGPQSGTILEEPSRVRLHELAMTASHDCNLKAWAKYI